MADAKDVKVQKNGDVHVFFSPTYYDKDVGENVKKLVTDLFKQGHKLFVIDFSGCKVANSPGISALMDVALKVLDDYRGKLVLCSLDPTKESVFTLVGVIPLAPAAKTLEEAVQLARIP